MPKYARFDMNAPAPHPVTGWYDTDAINYPNLPPASELVEVTDEEWNARLVDPTAWVITEDRHLQHDPTPRPQLREPPPRMVREPQLVRIPRHLIRPSAEPSKAKEQKP